GRIYHQPDKIKSKPPLEIGGGGLGITPSFLPLTIAVDNDPKPGSELEIFSSYPTEPMNLPSSRSILFLCFVFPSAASNSPCAGAAIAAAAEPSLPKAEAGSTSY
ncbi:hypothetical protein FRX31_008117, partial [Thalictrum thalictroides]